MNDELDTVECLKNKMIAERLTQHDITLAIKCQPTTLSRWLLKKSKPSYAWEKIIKDYLQK